MCYLYNSKVWRGFLMRVELDPPLCILGISYLIIQEKFQVAALLLLILTLTEPPNAWKSEIYLFLVRYTVDLCTHFKTRPISNVLVWYPKLTTMTSVSVRFKKMTASHRLNYRVKPKTIINNQGNWGTVSIKKRTADCGLGIKYGLGVRSIQPKFQPVRPGKLVHLKRWTRFFETFPVGLNRSIEIWTQISENFGWMDRTP